ncbi:class I SAM-dependent methyltransferase [Amycolatopsis minnesotensis]|uniref:Class I SAM-dependent methyltransferase n=1 Tax=Amycolatopsis minnesotensis TaxID=337894 RepID=A0ABN2QWT5_9PSEU
MVRARRPAGPGDRNDPHAQARAARRAPLLLHSLSVFQEIFELLFTHRRIATVVEIGVETGQASTLYTELGASDVYCVEPRPSPALRATIDAHDGLRLVEAPSPQALEGIPVADLYVIDGDHNYATVKQELDWILHYAPGAVAVLHDVLWPCGRRDTYYQPSRLPAPHEATADGPTVWHDDTTPAGLVGMGAFTTASHAGGELNGVLTAVEDALRDAASPEPRMALIPAVFGLGIVLRPTSDDKQLLPLLERYQNSALLAAMEDNRIALYTRILQLQYEAARHAEHADALANTISQLRARTDDLERGNRQ